MNINKYICMNHQVILKYIRKINEKNSMFYDPQFLGYKLFGSNNNTKIINIIKI